MACINFSMLPTNFSSMTHNLNFPPTITWSNFDAPLPAYKYVRHTIDGHMKTSCFSLMCPCANCIAHHMTLYKDWRAPPPGPSDEHYVKGLNHVYKCFFSFWISKTMSPLVSSGVATGYARYALAYPAAPTTRVLYIYTHTYNSISICIVKCKKKKKLM
jgi:hypothetical protein